MTKQPSDLENVAIETAANLTHESWEKMRSVSFAGAGVCTALLLFVLQAPDLRQRSSTALLLICTGLPLLLASAFMVENFVTHGESSYKRLARPSAFWVMAAAFYLGGTCLVGSIFVLLHLFFPSIAWFFLAMSLLALIATIWHQGATKPGA